MVVCCVDRKLVFAWKDEHLQNRYFTHRNLLAEDLSLQEQAWRGSPAHLVTHPARGLLGAGAHGAVVTG